MRMAAGDMSAVPGMVPGMGMAFPVGTYTCMTASVSGACC